MRNHQYLVRRWLKTWPILLLATNLSAAVLYVDVHSTNPVPPYSNWATAANVIQDAVDVTAAGDEVVVTNGTYAAGGRTVHGAIVNRVAVDKPISLRSVNGPEVTIIEGYQVPGLTNWYGAVRCVYLTNGASLTGFTLTHGATLYYGGERDISGGGVFCESLSAVIDTCTFTDNSAHYHGGGAYLGTLYNCTLTGNSSYLKGGGADSCTLNNCTLTGNSADSGGGAFGGTLNNCVLTDNSANSGGGADSGTLSNCTLTANSAWSGGGSHDCTLNNCTLSDNSADHNAGGSYSDTLNNCTLAGNSARFEGGGAYLGTLNNCTLTGNSAPYGGGSDRGTLNNCTVAGNSAGSLGGGAYLGTLNNCIVYYNIAPFARNYSGSTLDNCCTAPEPGSIGEIYSAPLFVDTNGWSNLRLQSNSPCINTGNNTYVTNSTDLDGRPRIVNSTVDIGAYEFQGPGMSEFIGWLQRYKQPTDGSADRADPDSDGRNNWQEWIAGTDPTDRHSVLRMIGLLPHSPGLSVSWQSVANRTYFLERATDLGSSPAFLPLRSNLTGQAGTTVFRDTNAVGTGPYFYRVGVQQ